MTTNGKIFSAAKVGVVGPLPPALRRAFKRRRRGKRADGQENGRRRKFILVNSKALTQGPAQGKDIINTFYTAGSTLHDSSFTPKF